MLKKSTFLFVLITILALILSACGGSKPAEPAPAAEQPAAEQPAAEQPAAEQPAAEQPAAEQPAAEQPAAEQPAVAAFQEITRWGKGRINGVAYAAGGQNLVVAATTGLFVYDTAAWGEPRFIDLGNESAYSLAVSPDGATLAVGMESGKISLISLADGAMMKELPGHTDIVTCLAFSPDGATLVSGSNDWSFAFWKTADGTLIQTVDGFTASRVNDVAFSPDGTMAAIAMEYPDNKVLVWKIGAESPFQVLTGHTEAVSGVVFSPDKTTLASSSRDGTIKIWQIDNGAELKSITTEGLPELQKPTPTSVPEGTMTEEQKAQLEASQKALEALGIPFVFNLAYSPDGSMIAAGYFDNVVRIWKVADGTLFETLKGHKGVVYNVAFSPDGASLASRSMDGTVRVWNVADGANTQTFDFGFAVATLAFSPDGGSIAVGGEAYDTLLRNVADGATIREFPGHINRVTSVTFNADGSKISAGSVDAEAMVWDTADGKFNFAFPVQGGIMDVAFAPDDGSIAASTAASNLVVMWNLADGKALRSFVGHTGSVNSLAFSPDGTMLATGASDQSIRLWFVQDAKEIMSLSGHLDRVTAVAFSPDGETLYSASTDMTLRTWAIPSGEAGKTVTMDSPIVSMAVSADGAMLALGLQSGSIAIFQTANLDAPVNTIAAHKLDVNALAFSPDGSKLASGSRDGLVKFWQVK